MSDDAAPVKRGRKANAEKTEKVEKEKAEPKKRARKVLAIFCITHLKINISFDFFNDLLCV